MNEKEYSSIVASLEDVRDSLMRKEIGDDGWDLRDELLELRSIVATLVYVLRPNK